MFRFCAIGLMAVLFGACATAGEKSIDEQVNGLWMYTGLVTGDGTEMPLTGTFLFKDGIFVQQAVFDGGVFEENQYSLLQRRGDLWRSSGALLEWGSGKP